MTGRTAADGDAVAAATAAELALLDPGVRTSGAAALLHPGFVEFGSSGRQWSRAEIIEAMAGELSMTGEPVAVTEMRGERLADDVVHLTYLSRVAGRVARRSSIWRGTGTGWLLWFHQGTPVPDPAPWAS